MRILEKRVYRGRNIYSHSPVIRLKLDLGEHYDTPTSRIEGFNQSLARILPGLKKHRCSRGYEGGFWERLDEGTYIAHVFEHMAIEIQNILGYDVWFGKARMAEDERTYYVIYEYLNEDVGVEAGLLVYDIICGLLEQKELYIEDRLAKLKQLAVKTDLGPSTSAIVEEAKLRGIPFIRIGKGSILQLGYGKYQKRIEATITENTSCISVDISCDKIVTKELLYDAGIPVPEGGAAHDYPGALAIARQLGYPVAVKPHNGNQGKGVSLNISSDEELKTAYEAAAALSDKVIVEKQVPGKNYRVLVVGDNVAAVAERLPVTVTGDGVNSIRELINIENGNPLRGEGHEKPLTKIKIDQCIEMVLGRQGIGLDYIPQKNEVIVVRENGNLSTGGSAVDKTDKIHPQVSMTAVRAAGIIGLDIAGVDITTTDISKPLHATGGAVIEVNAAPGIRMHHYPSKGKPRNVARSVVDMLFPRGSQYSIPIVSITGSNGKTTTARMLSNILAISGYNVGCTTTGGIYINQKCIQEGDTTGPSSARTVLTDRTVDIAVLETARGGIVRSGLGYDLADVGIITNISGDHLGLDGINTIEDLVNVKSLVVEAVKYDGFAVLNADDVYVAGMADRVRCSIIYFSHRDDNVLILKHINNGRTAVFIREGMIVIAKNGKYYPVIPVGEVPCTMGGKLRHNIENTLAVVCGAYALNVPVGDIVKGLKTFYNDHQNNPGRFNIYSIGNFRIMVDYGHNPAGYRVVTEALTSLGAERLVGVIGVPGDRLDSDMIEVGKICSGVFDKVYIKEDKDLRGRERGEVAQRLYQGLLEGGFPASRIEIEYDETRALWKAMKTAKPGDLISIFYEKLPPVLETIERGSSILQAKPRSKSLLNRTAGK
ncbi:MAG: Cyanophycin synthase [Firmicutes bacterium]|nr:Cyanophycin synthase [Bacillota bacterium]MDI6705135.1 cyanophycin synthetase [Bacillota bacterium]